jgi:hypothetical protein
MFMQMIRPSATEQGLIVGPPYHCDINAMRALFSDKDWVWPKPPYARVAHPNLSHELALRLVRRIADVSQAEKPFRPASVQDIV